MDSKSENSLCNNCGKLFSKKRYLSQHLKIIHQINAKGEKLPDSKFPCDLCDRQFKAKSDLKRHMNAIHLSDKTSNVFECVFCSFKTAYEWNLKKHLARHEKKTDTTTQPQFKCNQCNASYRHKFNLKSHERKAHNVNHSKRTVCRKCPLCPFLSREISRVEMNNHFIIKHNIPLKWETYSFENLEQFYKWKDGMEKSTNTFFVTKEKSKRFSCHRNGVYKPEGKNIRRLKVGSCKINAFCPSEIKVHLQKSKRVDVKFLPCHVGHKNQLIRKRLTFNEKKNIANKLLNKPQHESILSDKRSSLRDSDLKRITATHHVAQVQDNNNDKLINLEEKDDTSVVNVNYDEIEQNVEEEILNANYDEIEQNVEEEILDEICFQDNDIDESDKKKLEVYKLYSDFVFKNAISRDQIEYAVETMKQLKSTIEAMASTSDRVIKQQNEVSLS